MTTLSMIKTKNNMTLNFSFIIQRRKKHRKIGDVLKTLGLDKIGSGNSRLSLEHDNILYK